jgi:WXXGXW repeat (2 copies)
MNKRKLLFAAIVSTTLAAVALPAAAAVDFYVNIAPPAPRYEVVPAPRVGYVWAPGYWDYRANRYVWSKGHWERERRGYYYHPTQWYENNGRWYRYTSRWATVPNHSRYYDGRTWRSGDRDHDGVPNRVDRDRDGDGVPNSRDRQPDNPRRN